MARSLRWAVSMLAIGALLGYIVTALVGPTIEETGWLGVNESREARQFMVAMLEMEPEALVALTPKSDIVSRAMQYKQAEGSQGQWTPVSLTYLGGKTSGGFSVQIYAIELRSARGREQFIPLALTLSGGKVIRRA